MQQFDTTVSNPEINSFLFSQAKEFLLKLSNYTLRKEKETEKKERKKTSTNINR